MIQNRKKIAAMTAVMAYIRTEEDVAVMASRALSPGMAPAPVAGPIVQAKPWGMSGRQDMMHLRAMMQMKAFHGVRPR